ncbi:MAG: glycosyltransferase family 2 protein [Phycisphaerales bacterium]
MSGAAGSSVAARGPSPAAPGAHGARRSNIEVVFTVKNEEINLPYALAAVMPWADKVWVVDSESTDRTREIAREFGAKVVVQTWLGYAGQKNWCLDHLPIESEWVLIVDGDEVVQPDLRDSMMAVAARPAAGVPEAAFYVNRYFVFLGKRIRHCGFYPSWNIRFVRPAKARYEMRDVHEHMVVNGAVGFLGGHLEHNDRRGLEVYMDKHNKYSTLEAREIFRASRGESSEQFEGRLFGTAPQRRRWIKRHIYARVRPKWLFRFLYSYIVKLGFLDGVNGLRFCLFISAYELLIDLKLVELRVEAAKEDVASDAAAAAHRGGL